MGIIFICCKQDTTHFSLPIFSVFTGEDPTDPTASRAFVDTQKRTYSSWVDWKTNNTLPPLKYATPRWGFFTCSPAVPQYEFDRDREPNLEFDDSPASSTLAQVARKTDIVSVITSFGCGAVGVASIFTPFGPIAMGTIFVVGGTSAVYGAGR